ncbi:hypothetical protein QBC39DRAFT_340505 [Podospora conica]|nr:hypothetical protein QBC39DRAFT_340505 [Schizothecium conicum]
MASNVPPSASPRRYETLRKPLPNPPSSSCAPALAIDDYGNPIHHHSVPSLPLYAPPPIPGATPTSHSRTSSFPTMLKKQPKMDPAPAPVQPHMAVSSPPQEPTRESRRESSPVSSQPPGAAKLHTNRLRPVSPSPVRGRSSSAQPPKVRQISVDAPRVASGPPATVRPTSADGDSGKAKKRRSWLPGGRSRANSNEMGGDNRTGAWIITPGSRSDYNTSLLLNGEKIPELWNEAGSVSIYLFSKESGRGPSFRVADKVFSASRVIHELLMEDAIAAHDRGMGLLSVNDAADRGFRPAPGENRVFLPLTNTDLDSLVAARNLFAFLTGQPLLGTKKYPNLFGALLQVASQLRSLGFVSYDGSSFGEEVDAAFDALAEQYGLADVRDSREKTIEALVLAEQMRSWNLYNEAYAHAVGKYDDLVDLDSPLFSQISTQTRSRLERSHLDLLNRQQSVNLRLEAFEFPSLFAGLASSTSHEEYRAVRFKEWRNSFAKMRNFVLAYYKGEFGNWPPKAKSKKNRFSRGGLNRQCLKILYWDLCSLYDLLVDREAPTTRTIDRCDDDNQEDAGANPSIAALRTILSEFDHSSPPVLPPMPFDVPKLPSMTAIHENYNDLPTKKQAKFDKSLQSNELQLLLIKSRNIDTNLLSRPFLDAYREFELKEARSVHPQDLADQRIGYWLFLYVVLQSLPMLVVDAPGLRHTEGVEYFLSQAPQGNAPWDEDAGEVRKMWYRSAGQGLVELSTDVVMFSVEGTYSRSHCWMAAKRWQEAAANGDPVVAPPGAPPVTVDADSDDVAADRGAGPLEPPRAVFQDMDPVAAGSGGGGASPGAGSGSPSGSPSLRPRTAAQKHAYRYSVAIGLEPLALGEEVPGGEGRGGSVGGHSRHSSVVGGMSPASGGGGADVSSSTSLGGVGDPTKTFDDILKGMEPKEKKKRSFF